MSYRGVRSANPKLTNFDALESVCREELDELVKKSNGRFKLHHTLSAIPEGWTGSKGRMSRSMYEAHLPTPSEDALVLICGPDAMINQTAKPLLVSRIGLSPLQERANPKFDICAV